jgi:hypothetical protein
MIKKAKRSLEDMIEAGRANKRLLGPTSSDDKVLYTCVALDGSAMRRHYLEEFADTKMVSGHPD